MIASQIDRLIQYYDVFHPASHHTRVVDNANANANSFYHVQFYLEGRRELG